MSFPFGDATYPRWNQNYIPTPSEWQSWFSRKADDAIISDAISSLDTQITDETARAKASEQVNAKAIAANATAITDEITRATDAEATLLSRIEQIRTVKDFGAKGDGDTDDTAAFKAAISETEYAYVPQGNYVITDASVLLSSQYFYGPGILTYDGYEFPAGDVEIFVNLNVPSVFPTIQDAVTWCELHRFSGASGFASINIADGTYSLTQIEPQFPEGSDRIQFIGNTETPANVVLNFDGTNNQCGFLFQRGNGCYLIDGVTINSENAWVSHGVWNDQCYGAAIMAQYGSRTVVGGSVRINNFYYGVSSRYGSVIYCHPGVIVQQAGDVGFHAFGSASINAQNCQALYCAHTSEGLGFGFCAESSGFVDCSFGNAANNAVAGFYANNGGAVWAHSTTTDANYYGIYAINGGRIECNKGASGDAQTNSYNNTSHGYYALNGAYINANSCLAASNGGSGYVASNGGFIDVTASNASNSGAHGYLAYQHGGLAGDSPNAYENGGDGFQANTMGSISCTNLVTNTNTGYGLHAINLSFMLVPSATIESNVGGTMSPSTSGTAGNNGSYIDTSAS
ncbi:glycosyl hydrolase family 28-related protein [Gluconobacter kondonii]|uniref:glycosyl hydrolase family 28-related protein n=1 Tax=Gluconobacter kondonii TaxID=941463 RepID=UPI001B8D1AA1|nr:glycosyl hydrolase family 28-related protein [Gluconobacter kondonii]MBS1079103.1 hypothetical protein [Gluconobacter kondonii]